MKIKKTLIVIAVFIFSFSIGCNSKKTSEYRLLEYQFPENNELEYKLSNNIKQNSIITEKNKVHTTTTNTNVTENLYMLGLGLIDDNNFEVEFYVDDINVTTDDPQIKKDVAKNFSFIANKKYSALVSKKGAVSSVEAIDVIKFPNNPIGQYDMRLMYDPGLDIFPSFFFTLPENELKVGETWSDNTTETYNEKEFKETSHYEYSYKVSDVVNYKGYSCLKIVGTVKMTVSGQGVDKGSKSGEGTGTRIYYFAKNEGIIVASELNGNSRITQNYPTTKTTIEVTNISFIKFELVK